MENNWLSIVRGDGEARACVFCGQHRREHCKSIGVSAVLSMLNAQQPCLQDELFSRAMRNVCDAALATHAAWQNDDRDAGFSACLCCHHWVARRKKGRLVFPLQALVWYVNTMRPLGKKNMDHRVVMRLCQTLSEPGPAVKLPHTTHLTASTQAASTQAASTQAASTQVSNFYSSLFSSQEKALFAQIACTTIDNIGDVIARYYHTQNAHSIFSASSSLVEKLRKSESRKDRPQPHHTQPHHTQPHHTQPHHTQPHHTQPLTQLHQPPPPPDD